MAELDYKPFLCPTRDCDYRDVQAGGIKRHCLIRHKEKNVYGEHRREDDKEELISRLVAEGKQTKSMLFVYCD